MSISVENAYDSLDSDDKVKLLSFACVGHCLELYDHTLYGVMLPFLVLSFFPAVDLNTSVFLGFLSFTLAFIISPLGSFFWGWYSDKFGRIAMLRITMLIMGFPSLGIALLPSYNKIGIIAPFLLILFRILQGFSSSGEIMGARVFMMEVLGENKNGFASGLMTAMGALGVFLAMGMGYWCSLYPNIENFWRISFLLGAILFIVGRCIRTRLMFSLFTLNETLTKTRTISLKQTFYILKDHPFHSLIVLVLGATTGIMSYTLHAFINPFLMQQGISAKLLYLYSMVGLIFTIIAAIGIGYYVDKHQKVHTTLCRIMLIYSVFSCCFFIFFQKGGWHTLIAYMGFASILGGYVCLSGIVMYRTFSQEIRGRGILFNYALGCATFGSLTPLTLNYFSKYHFYLPGILLSIFGGIALFLFQSARKQLNQKPAILQNDFQVV